jgi:competence protein ComGF
MKCRDVQFLNKRGFTLVEVLIAFSIFSTIVFFFMPTFQIILSNKDTQSEIQGMEWEVFSSQMKKEMRLSSRAEIISGRLILTKDTETVQFEKYGTNIRRRVNSTGHEIILQNVSQFSLSLINNAVKITVTDTWGKVYSLTLYSMVDWNKVI